MENASKKAEKVANYSEEQTSALVAAYKGAETTESREAVVAQFAEIFGKSARSIIAKLTKEGVYIKKAYTTKSGAAPEKKDATADAIGKVLQLSEPDTDSLTKANKKALQKVWAALVNSEPVEALTPEETKTKGENVAAIAAVLEMDEGEAKSLARCGASALAVLAYHFTAE